MNVKRIILLALGFSLIIVVLHTAVYGSILSADYYSLSNLSFLVGVIVFFPSLALRLGSANLFLGFRYSIYRFVNANNKMKQYESFKDYLDEKKYQSKSAIYSEVLLVSLFFLIASSILAFNWSP